MVNWTAWALAIVLCGVAAIASLAMSAAGGGLFTLPGLDQFGTVGLLALATLVLGGLGVAAGEVSGA
jgi:hypothetical protein